MKGTFSRFLVDIFSILVHLCIFVDLDPDPKGSEPFCRIQNRIFGSDPEPGGSVKQFFCSKTKNVCSRSKSVFRIRISLNADPDPDRGFYLNADPDSGFWIPDPDPRS